MPSTFVNNLRLEEMATGEQSGQWGTKTNTNLELIGEALGFGTEAITTNADTHASVIADGASDGGSGIDGVRAMYVKFSGTLDSACTITISPNDIRRLHFIENGTSGSQNIIISQGSGSNVTITPGTTKAVYLDGGGSSANVVDAFAHLAAVDLTVDDDLIVGDDLTLSSDSSVINMGAGNDVTLTHDGTTGVTLAANPITLDSGGDITLDADGGDILFKDGGTTIGELKNNSNFFRIKSAVNNQDMEFVGVDDSSDVVALRLDMSDAGTAAFNHDATFVDNAIIKLGAGTDLTLTSDGTNGTINAPNGILNLDSASEVEVTAATIDLTASSKVTVSNDVEVTGRSVGVTVTAENDGSFDLAVGNDFTCTTAGNTEITFSNAAAGQSGNIKFVNASDHTITANALVAINESVLSTISASGTYHLAYYVTAASGNNSILVSASAALT